MFGVPGHRQDQQHSEPHEHRDPCAAHFHPARWQSGDLAFDGAPTSSATIAENVVILDGRSGVSAGTITGREDFAANARAHFDVFADARITVLAVRGRPTGPRPDGVPGRRIRLRPG